jgi:hypothetical protein
MAAQPGLTLGLYRITTVAQYAAQTHRGWWFSNFGDRLRARRNRADELVVENGGVMPGEPQYDVVVVGGESGETYDELKTWKLAPYAQNDCAA